MLLKNIFDLLAAILLLPFLAPLILILILIATIDTGQFGLFSQTRIGKHAKPFSIYKIRTMKGNQESDITTKKHMKLPKRETLFVIPN